MPADAVSVVLSALIAHEAEIEASEGGTVAWTLRGSLPARTVQEMEKVLPGLTRGEAVWLSHPAGIGWCGCGRRGECAPTGIPGIWKGI